MPKQYGTPGPRTIWPDEWLAVAGCSMGAQLLQTRLKVKADDQGRMLADPTQVRATCLQGARATDRDVAAWLSELADAGDISLYTAAGFRLLQELRWWGPEGQNPRRAYPSRFPAPEGWQDLVYGVPGAPKEKPAGGGFAQPPRAQSARTAPAERAQPAGKVPAVRAQNAGKVRADRRLLHAPREAGKPEPEPVPGPVPGSTSNASPGPFGTTPSLDASAVGMPVENPDRPPAALPAAVGAALGDGHHSAEAAELARGAAAILGRPLRPEERSVAEEIVAELRGLTVPGMLGRMRDHVATCQARGFPAPRTLSGFWPSLRRENDHRRDQGDRPRDYEPRGGTELTSVGDVLSPPGGATP